jgi:hypothetical protein
VSAALRANSIPERALLRAAEVDVLALSPAVDAEIADVLCRPKFAGAISDQRRGALLKALRDAAVWFSLRCASPIAVIPMTINISNSR